MKIPAGPYPRNTRPFCSLQDRQTTEYAIEADQRHPFGISYQATLWLLIIVHQAEVSWVKGPRRLLKVRALDLGKEVLGC